MKWFRLLFVIGFLTITSACSSNISALATNTLQPTNTLQQTITPTELPPLTGKLFFDMNGSGLMDESSFNYDPTRLTDEKQPLQADLLKVVNDYVNSHSELKEGDLITIPEPGLSGYKVCIENDCAMTNQDGSFEIPNTTGKTTAQIQITDSNSNSPALAMRYINEWKGPVVIDAYEMNGVQVPEQHLNDTEVIPITNGINLDHDGDNNIGLMQGFLTYPYYKNSYYIGLWFDHSLEKGHYQNYKGDNNPFNNPASVNISGDNHDGTDFSVPIGTDVASMAEGKVNFSDQISTNGPLHTTIEHLDGKFASGTGHHSVLLVLRDEKIYRGQILALSGKSATSWPHIHLSFHYDYDKRNEKIVTTDPFGIIYYSDNNFEKLSWWTVHNLPQFPLIINALE